MKIWATAQLEEGEIEGHSGGQNLMAKLFKFWVPVLSKLSHAINATFVAAMPSIFTCGLPLYVFQVCLCVFSGNSSSYHSKRFLH